MMQAVLLIFLNEASSKRSVRLIVEPVMERDEIGASSNASSETSFRAYVAGAALR